MSARHGRPAQPAPTGHAARSTGADDRRLRDARAARGCECGAGAGDRHDHERHERQRGRHLRRPGLLRTDQHRQRDVVQQRQRPQSASPNTSTWSHTVTVSATATGGMTPIRIELYDDDGDLREPARRRRPRRMPARAPLYGVRDAHHQPAIGRLLRPGPLARRANGRIHRRDSAPEGTPPERPARRRHASRAPRAAARRCASRSPSARPIPETLTVTKTPDTDDRLCTPNDCSLREAIVAATQGT